jgi:tetratricopeptide (TPR) repeat protein
LIKEQTSKETFSKAYDLVRSGKYIEAEPLLCKLLDRHPDHPDVLHLMGLVFLETYRLDDSVHAFKSAVENCPDQARYHYHYGLSLIRKNDIDNAISSFNTALALDGDFQDARYNLAKALKDQGDLEKSATIYEQLLEKEPLHADALYNLANLRYEMDMLSESENLFRQLLSKNPKHLNARTNYALIQSRTGRTEEAIRILEKTLSIDPNHKSARQLLQKLYSSKIPSWHFDMLNDEKRNDAYDRAIRKTVVNANQVLEIGTGSGLLSMMAARAGARKVVTCEMCRFLAKIAEKIIEKNGFADRIRVINQNPNQPRWNLPSDCILV